MKKNKKALRGFKVKPPDGSKKIYLTKPEVRALRLVYCDGVRTHNLNSKMYLALAKANLKVDLLGEKLTSLWEAIT